MTTEKAKTNATTKPAADKNTAKQAADKKIEIGSAASRAAADDEQEADENASADSQASQQAGDDIGYELTESRDDDFQIRGFLMAIIIRLPRQMRMIADGTKLDEMVLFVLGFEDYSERIVAVELLKAIGESDPAKIASGAYKNAVQEAFDVINGVAANRHELGDHDSQAAAFNRMQLVTSGLTERPIEAGKAPTEPADDAQESAMSRLYATQSLA